MFSLKIEQNKELGILSKKLATIITDVPIDYKIEELKLNVTNLDKAREIFEELEFRRIISSLNSIFSINNEKNESEPQKIKKDMSMLYVNLDPPPFKIYMLCLSQALCVCV